MESDVGGRRQYYEWYWSGEGIQPGRRLYPELERLLERYSRPGDLCLDVACGDAGTCGPWLSARTAGYVGADISLTALQGARRQGFNVVAIEDGALLPLASGSFDFATCFEALHLMIDPHRTVAEIVRVLRPGGRLLVTVPNAVYWRRRLDSLVGRWNPGASEDGVGRPWLDPACRFFTPGTLKRLLEDAGLDRVVVGGHYGGVLTDLPGLRRFARVGEGGEGRAASALYRLVEARMPALLAYRLHAVGSRPA